MNNQIDRINKAIKKVKKFPRNYPEVFPESMGREHIKIWKNKIKYHFPDLFSVLSNEWIIKDVPFETTELIKKITAQFRHQSFKPDHFDNLKTNIKDEGFLSHVDSRYLLPLYFIFGDGTVNDVIELITGIHREKLFKKEYQMDSTHGVCVRVNPEWTAESLDERFWKDISGFAKYVANPKKIIQAEGNDEDMSVDVIREMKTTHGKDFEKILEDEDLLQEEITRACRTIIEHNESCNIVGFNFKAVQVKTRKINDLAKIVAASKDFSGKRSSFNTTPDTKDAITHLANTEYPQSKNGVSIHLQYCSGAVGNLQKLMWRDPTIINGISHIVLSTDAGNANELYENRIKQYKGSLEGLYREVKRSWINATKKTTSYKNLDKKQKKDHRQEMVNGYMKYNEAKYFTNNAVENPSEDELYITVASVLSKTLRDKLYNASSLARFVETGEI